MSEVIDVGSRREFGRGLETRVINRLTHQEFHLTLQPLPGERPAQMVARLVSAFRERDASVVRHEIFGAISARSETVSALHDECGPINWPIMWVEGANGNDRGIAGMHVFAIAGVQVDTLDWGGRPVGRLYNDGYARHCLLGDLRPLDPSASQGDQCQQTLQLLEDVLGGAGMSLKNVIRTWFFLENILGWYGRFNVVRNQFYQKRNVFNGLMPASTGIGGSNPAGTAIVAGAWATQKISDDIAISDVVSPLQRSSLDYGSAFCRALSMATPDVERLFISGTASIELNGQSMHRGNVSDQIGLTMEVVRQILSSQGCSFNDATRATVYFKNIGDISAFEAWKLRQNIKCLPVLAASGDICRDELLFEIELDAVRKCSKHRVREAS